MASRAGQRRRKKTKRDDKKASLEISQDEASSSHPDSLFPSLTCPICLRFDSRDRTELAGHFESQHGADEVARELARILEEIAGGEEVQHDQDYSVDFVPDDEPVAVEAAEVEEEEENNPVTERPRRTGRKSLGKEAQQVKTKKKSLSCDVCHKTFASRGNLNKHAVRHSDKKPFQCKECGQSFLQKRDLKTHEMQKHTGERPHVCDLCGKGFVHKFYLSEHMDYHSGAKRHQCFKCGKKFSSSSILAKHMGRHNAEKKHRCEKCQKTFVIKSDLASHVRMVHNKGGRDKPAFPAKMSSKKGKKSLIPPNYSVIESEVSHNNPSETVVTADGRTVPFYEKPRPVLRMVSNPSDELIGYNVGNRDGFDQTAPLPSFKHLNDAGPAMEAGIAAQPLTAEEEAARLKEIESQRQIEEWMIAEGINLGQPDQIPDMMQQQQQQQQQHVALKIPNVTHLSMTDFQQQQHLLETSNQIPASSSLTIPPFITLRTLLPIKPEDPSLLPLKPPEVALPTTPVTPSPLTPSNTPAMPLPRSSHNNPSDGKHQ